MDKSFKNRKSKAKDTKPKMKFTIDSSVYVPKIQEPKVECCLCHKEIDSITEAICEQDGTYSHFDCAIDKIKSEHNLQPGQKVSYLGKGVFGIIETKDGKFTILERIVYETSETFNTMKNFVESQKK